MGERSAVEVGPGGPKEDRWRNWPTRGRSALASIKALLAVVGCLAAVFWAWRIVEESRRPALAWARQLESGRPEDRRIAARQLGDCQGDDLTLALNSLSAALDDREEQVRVEVVSALGTLGLTALDDKAHRKESRAATVGLIKAIGDSGSEVRRAAAAALGEFAAHPKDSGYPADPGSTASALVEMLTGPSELDRAQAERSLTQIGTAIPLAPPRVLVTGLETWEATPARASAAFVLGSYRLEPENTVNALARALKDREPAVRSRAAAALQKFGPDAEPAIPALVATFADPFAPPPEPDHPRVMASLGSESATSSNQVAIDPAVEAIHAVGRIEGALASKGKIPPKSVLDPLAVALSADRPAIREAAVLAYRRIGRGASAAAPDLVRALSESITNGRFGPATSIARALGDVAPGSDSAPSAIAALVRALDSEDPEARRSAASALGKFKTAATEALPRLRELGSDPDSATASIAKAASDAIEGKAPPAAPRRKGQRGGNAPRR